MNQQDSSITVDGLTDKEHSLLCIFYLDKTSKDTFQAFPEILFIDATHKLNSLKMPLYVFLICDENGQSEIIPACLVTSEQRAIINEIIGTLQKYNAS